MAPKQVHRGVKRFAAMRPDAADAEEQRPAPKRARLVGPARDPISVADAQVLEGQQCLLQKMNSVAYRRAVKRPSTWVLAQYFDGGSTEKINKYAAHIEFWAAPAPKRKQPVSDVNPDQWYGIDGELLHTMLVCAFPDGEGVGDMYFVPYNSLSKA
ncbi:hypothetical protein HaLaN_02702 [Haematococcus lacustris]|uniref:Uncharacterized protein n=1 Tax=Haematococcus lacustris TaxID=44745 RepID=A0A699YEI6_HAELA|nr:hypothetical protein HaLaN_02702 [Haematococcus lacustris]